MGMFEELHKQRLEEQRKNDARPPTKPERKEGTKEPTNQARKEAWKQGSLEPRDQGTLAIRTAPPQQPAAADQPLFDINERTERSNTFEFTRAELWAIEDLQKELERALDIDVNKYDIVRCAIHCLIEDHKRNGSTSFAATRLQLKKRH